MTAILQAVLEEAREKVLDPDFKAVRRWREAVRGRAVVASDTPWFPTAMAEALGMLHLSQPPDGAPADIRFEAALHDSRAHRLDLPADPEAGDAVPALERRLARVGHLLELASGKSLTPILLRAALHAIDHDVTLMRRLLELRASQPERLTLSDTMLLLRLGARMPRREHAALLERAVIELERRSVGPAPAKRPRAVLVTLGAIAPPLELLDDAERRGLVIADHDLDPGERLSAAPRPDGSALTVLAETYVHAARHWPAPYNPNLARATWVVARARRVAADTALIAVPADSAAAWVEVEQVEKALAHAGISHLLLPWDSATGAAAVVAAALETTVR